MVMVFAAVIAAVFMRQQDEATATAASRNLQQWGIALNLYLIDNQNQLPETGAAPVSPDQRRAWYNALPPYISQPALANLAAGERPRPGEPSLWMDPRVRAARIWDPEQFFFHYAMNRFLQPDPETRSFRVYELDRPGRVVFLFPTDGYAPAGGPDEVAFRSNSHPEALVLFCDGHVETVPGGEMVDNPEALKADRAAAGGLSWFAE